MIKRQFQDTRLNQLPLNLIRVGTTLSLALLSACGGGDTSPSHQEDTSAKSNSGNTSSNSTHTNDPSKNSGGATRDGGFSINAPGSKAAFKKFTGTAAPNKFKAIYITLNGFSEEPKTVETDGKADLQISWMFLSESQNVVDREADQSWPKKVSTGTDSVELLFQQTHSCRSFSRLEVNGDVKYYVAGSCIYVSEIDIPKAFTSSVFINNKLIHESKLYN